MTDTDIGLEFGLSYGDDSGSDQSYSPDDDISYDVSYDEGDYASEDSYNEVSEEITIKELMQQKEPKEGSLKKDIPSKIRGHRTNMMKLEDDDESKPDVACTSSADSTDLMKAVSVLTENDEERAEKKSFMTKLLHFTAFVIVVSTAISFVGQHHMDLNGMKDKISQFIDNDFNRRLASRMKHRVAGMTDGIVTKVFENDFNKRLASRMKHRFDGVFDRLLQEIEEDEYDDSEIEGENLIYQDTDQDEMDKGNSIDHTEVNDKVQHDEISDDKKEEEDTDDNVLAANVNDEVYREEISEDKKETKEEEEKREESKKVKEKLQKFKEVEEKKEEYEEEEEEDEDEEDEEWHEWDIEDEEVTEYDEDDDFEVKEEDKIYSLGEILDAVRKHPDLLSKILSRQPELVNQRNANGSMLLHEAVMCRNVKSVASILTHIDDVSTLNARLYSDSVGGNALWLAKESGLEEIADLLKAKGAVTIMPNLERKENGNKHNGEVEVIEQSREKQEEENKEEYEEEEDEEEEEEEEDEEWHEWDIEDEEVTEYDEDDDFEVKEEDKIYSLGEILDAVRKHPDLLSKILSRQPELVNQRNANGSMLLHEAVMCRNVKSVASILTHIDDVSTLNARLYSDSVGGNALWLAKESGLEEIADLLKAKGAVTIMPNLERKAKRNKKVKVKEKYREEEDDKDQYEKELDGKDYEFEDALEAVIDNPSLLSTILSSQPELANRRDPSGSMLLHEAVLREKVESVSILLDHIDSVNIINVRVNSSGGWVSALWMAEQTGNQEIVDMLEDQGAYAYSPNEPLEDEDIFDEDQTDYEDIVSNDVEYTFKDALDAANNDSSMLSTILWKHPDWVRSTNDNGWTLLHEAVLNGNVESVEIILSYIYDVNIINLRMHPDKTGGNALWLANEIGHQKIIQMLKNNGGIPIEPESEEKTEPEPVNPDPVLARLTEISNAAQNELSSVSTLLAKWPHIAKEFDKDGYTLLHIAAWSGRLDSVQTILEHVDQFILNTRSLTNKTGGNAMWLAQEAGHYQIVDVLSSKGAVLLEPIEAIPEYELVQSVEEEIQEELVEEEPEPVEEPELVNPDPVLARLTEICKAAENELSSIPTLLKKFSYLASEVDSDGYTFLHLAAWSGNMDTIQAILEYADIVILNTRSLPDQTGGNAVWLAQEAGHFLIVDYLISQGAVSLEPQYQLINSVEDEIEEELLRNVESIEKLETVKENPKHVDDPELAKLTEISNAAQDDLSSIGRILEKWPHLAKQFNEDGYTLLHIAAWSGRLDSVKVISYYVDHIVLDVRSLHNKTGGNAMWLAQEAGHDDIVEWLRVKRGAVVLGPIEEEPESELVQSVEDEVEEEPAEPVESIEKLESVKENPKHVDPALAKLTEISNAAQDDLSSIGRILEKWPHLAKQFNEDGYTLLHIAAWSGRLDSVKVISYYVDHIVLDVRSLHNKTGGNAMWLAQEAGHDDIVEWLRVKRGAVVLGPIEEEQESVKEDMIEESSKQGVESETNDDTTSIEFTFTEASYAAQKASSWIPKILEKQPNLLKETDENGFNLLHIAAYSGNLESVQAISEYVDHIFMNVRSLQDEKGGNALYLAKEAGHSEVVEYLLSKGAIELEPEL